KEQISSKAGGQTKEAHINDFRKRLDNNTAVVAFAGLDNITHAVLAADGNGVTGKINYFSETIEPLMQRISDKCGMNAIQQKVSGLRGVKISGTGSEVSGNRNTIDEFNTIINYYRILLTNPSLTAKEVEERKFIASELYNYLFDGITGTTNGKTEIIILPDGILGFLPFETLIMPDGRYMAEKFNIKYAQSLGVLDLIASRKYSPPKPLLAFGGAVYQGKSSGGSEIKSGDDLDRLYKNTLDNLSRGGNSESAYQSLGLASWENLPGTLEEVKKLNGIVSSSEIITGAEVTEGKIKNLSKNGSLSKFKVIHFATHGLVVPEIPELSALVLSQTSSGGDDGYLRSSEIAELDIKADFVNLSACETGLGKIYGGEGVVGLTQSFLLAGANALSVSLWQVADESTSKFMTGLYAASEKNGHKYDLAMSQLKRDFISGKYGDELKKPYYWAPFVYYGK
ncbi:TPA: hypothetical protein DCR49_07190, partial [Candidatus Delongbacteria bacterium]|nr:hypothetical protein [Candidatus Delongbacteria bacterium]